MNAVCTTEVRPGETDARRSAGVGIGPQPAHSTDDAMKVSANSERSGESNPGAFHRIQGVPAVYIGTLLGFAKFPETELYNLIAPVGEYPLGATITRATLEKLAQQLRLAA